MLTWIFYAFVIATTFCIVVAWHELGHYLAMRRYNVPIKTFSVGMGPELWGKIDKKGTRWRLSWLPIGGYVMPQNEDYEKHITPWQSIIIFAAGPAFSIAPPFLIAWLYFVIENGFFSGSYIVVAETIKLYFSQFAAIGSLFAGSTTEVGGPVAIGGETIKATSELGFFGYVAFIFLLSGVLGMFNLLPIRPLDGGGILAGILRMALPENIYNRFNNISSIAGIFLMLGLIIYVTWIDITRLF